ncbi:MAG: DUF87 domain-containing protein [Thermoprotei archaeon]
MPELVIGSKDFESFGIDADQIVTGRTCIIGSSGSGKSYAVGVICEELCKNGIGFALVDTEGEHGGLAEKFDVVQISEDEGSLLTWQGLNLNALGQEAPNMPPLVMDFSEVSNPQGALQAFGSSLYKTISERRTPYLLIVEEIDKFVPQVGKRVEIIPEIARRGRKRGLGLMICTQRPSIVDKNVLSQCSNQLIGRLVLKNDLQAVQQFFPGRGLPEQLTALEPGSFFVMGNVSPVPSQIKFRKRETKHGGFTPRLEDRPRQVNIPNIKELLVKLTAPYEGEAEVQPVSQKQEALGRGSSGRVTAEQAQGQFIAALPALIYEENVPDILKKSFVNRLFGSDEKVGSVNLSYRPVFRVSVKRKSGILKKHYTTSFLFVDGVSGHTVDFEHGFRLGDDLRRFLGLKLKHIAVYRALSDKDFMSAVDVANQAGETKDSVKPLLKELEERNLIRSRIYGKIRFYRRAHVSPKLETSDRTPKPESVEPGHAIVEGTKIDADQLLYAIQGLIQDCEVDSCETIYYPLFKVELVFRNHVRERWIDARTGKTLEI